MARIYASHAAASQLCLALGASGLTVGSESGTVSTFSSSTGTFTSSIKKAHDGHVTCIAQSPLGVLSGGKDGCVKLWSAGAGDRVFFFFVRFTRPIAGECKHTFRDLAGAVAGVSVHPCGDYAAAAGEGGCWAFYDLAYGTCRQVFAGNTALSTGVFHPDGLIFATAEQGDALQLWDLKSERPALRFSAGSCTLLAMARRSFKTGFILSFRCRVWGHLLCRLLRERLLHRRRVRRALPSLYLCNILFRCGGVASVFDLRKLAKSQVAFTANARRIFPVYLSSPRRLILSLHRALAELSPLSMPAASTA